LLDAHEVRECLPMSDAIEAMRLAFDDDREVPPRVTLGASLFMAAESAATRASKWRRPFPGTRQGWSPCSAPMATRSGSWTARP
jgi:hypothetical protein